MRKAEQRRDSVTIEKHCPGAETTRGKTSLKKGTLTGAKGAMGTKDEREGTPSLSGPVSVAFSGRVMMTSGPVVG